MQNRRLTVSSSVRRVIVLAAVFFFLTPLNTLATDHQAMHLVQGPVQSAEQTAAYVAKMAAGLTHSGMIQYDGSVWLWGDNRYGQAGQADQDYIEQPQRIQLYDKAVDLSLGFFHTLILGESGNVYALGRNTFGQLGRSDMTESSRPVRVGQLPAIIAVSAGSLHSLALAEDGSVWAWGSNNNRQISDIRDEAIRDKDGQVIGRRQTVPVRVVEEKAVAIAAGGHHSLYLDDSGQVYAWGANDRGQLGLIETDDQGTPKPIDDLDQVIALSAGYQHNLALSRVSGQADQLFAWGDHSLGQTGTGEPVSETASVATPQAIDWRSYCPDPELTTTIDLIAAGAAHSAILIQSPEIESKVLERQHLLLWGDNSNVQLSSAVSAEYSAVPVLITVSADEHQGSAFRRMDSLALGGNHTLLLSSRGLAAVTGLNSQHQAGLPVSGKIAGFLPLKLDDMIKPAFQEGSQITVSRGKSQDQLTVKWPAAYDNHDLLVDYHVTISDRDRVLQELDTQASSAVFTAIDPQISLQVIVTVSDAAHQDAPAKQLSRLTAYWLPVETVLNSAESDQWPNGIQPTIYSVDQHQHHWRPAGSQLFQPLEVPWSLNDYYGETVLTPPVDRSLATALISAVGAVILLIIGLAVRRKIKTKPSNRQAAREKDTDTDQ